MSEFMSNQPNQGELDFFAHHEQGLTDFAWQHLYEEILSLNAEELTQKELLAYLPSLNMKLFSVGRFQARVLVSGKLRDVCAREDGTMSNATADVNLLPTEYDTHGQYRSVFCEQLVCRYFAVHTPGGVFSDDGTSDTFDEDDDFTSETISNENVAMLPPLLY